MEESTSPSASISPSESLSPSSSISPSGSVSPSASESSSVSESISPSSSLSPSTSKSSSISPSQSVSPSIPPNGLTQYDINMIPGKRYRLSFGTTATEEGLGSELITNGTFDGNAGGWNLIGNCSYENNYILCEFVDQESQGISQALGTQPNGFYKVTFNAIGVGTMNIYLGDSSIYQLNNSNGTVTINTNATFNFNDILQFGDAVSTFNGTIDDVSVKQILFTPSSIIVYQGGVEIFRTIISINVKDDIGIEDQVVDTSFVFLPETNDSLNITENNSVIIV